MFPVAAIIAAGWLFLFIVLLALPPSSRPRRGRAVDPPVPADPPPAVVSALAGKLDKYGYGATLADLAARGWFRLTPPVMAGGAAGQVMAGGPPGPAMCVVAGERPGEPLAPYERRVVAHVALRAGARGEVPAPALSDGFEGGEDAFMAEFREEVNADVRQRGLTRPRLSGRRIGLLCLLLFAPATALLIALAGAHKPHPAGSAILAYIAAVIVTGAVGASRRPSAAGRALLARWRAAAKAPGDARLAAYAAALGVAPAAAEVFAPAGRNVVWSSYRGSWQPLALEASEETWPWPKVIAMILLVVFGPLGFFVGVFWLFALGHGGVAVQLIGLVVAGVLASVAVSAARRRMLPRFAEFDGQVVRQRIVTSEDDPDEYHVTIDDGVSATAWDLKVPSETYRRMPPGTFVHARVNRRHRDQSAVDPVEPPAVARALADVAAEHQRAAFGGLPDPARLVTEQDAAAVMGGQVVGTHGAGPAGRTMTWQRTGTSLPILRIQVRDGAQRPLPPSARPVPGVAGGFLLHQGAVLYASPLTVIISITGTPPPGHENSLGWLVQLAATRLVAWRGTKPVQLN